MSESNALQAAIDFDQAGKAYATPLLPLPSHIRKLRRMIGAIHGGYRRTDVPTLDGVTETLNVAAALYDVRADTAIDDSSVNYCGAAATYVGAESVVASRYLAATIMFTFVWMALEQAVRTVAPPYKGSVGARGRKAFAQLTDPPAELATSLKLTWGFAAAAGDMKVDLAELSPLLVSAGPTEVAYELVRRTRNAFTHGHIIPPQPLEWQAGQLPPPSPEVDRFFAATRTALLLIAQLLSAAMPGRDLELPYDDQPYLEDEDEHLCDAPIDWALMTAHLQDAGLPPRYGQPLTVEIA